jgi:V8-like Glu-specific endopeptidase
MKRALAVLLVLVVLFLPLVAFASSIDVDRQHKATHHISMTNVVEQAGCSATAVGPHTLLTAGHCLLAANEIEVDGLITAVRSLQFDDADHMLVEVDESFNSYLPLQQRAPTEHELVHIWGNPGNARDIFRWGMYDRADALGHTPVEVFVLSAFPGDSGSGVLDNSGTVITVLA